MRREEKGRGEKVVEGRKLEVIGEREKGEGKVGERGVQDETEYMN